MAMIQSAIAGLPAKTGRSLDEWVEVIRKHGPNSDPARREWLKTTHKLGTNYAGWLADAAAGKGEDGVVPLYRRHVFAQIKPATLTRIDLGLALGNTKTPKRLVDTGGFEKRAYVLDA